MGDGVDNAFGEDFLGEFVVNRSLSALGAGADRAGDFREDKVNGLVHEVKGGACVNLVRGDGPADLGAVEVKAFDFGGDKEPLRFFGEKEDGGMGGVAVLQEVEVSERFGDGRVFVEDVLALTTRAAKEPAELVLGEVGDGGAGTAGRVEWNCAEESLFFEVLDQAGVELGGEVRASARKRWATYDG
jgi:hypothetical protein